jgi:hypothetical protein
VIYFPRGLSRKYLQQDGKWYALVLSVDELSLIKMVAHAADHHDESDEELFARGIFRYACANKSSWLAPLVSVLAPPQSFPESSFG